MSQHLEKNTTFVAAEDLSACNKLKLITSIIIKCMIFLLTIESALYSIYYVKMVKYLVQQRLYGTIR
jgi:hypothetical protein